MDDGVFDHGGGGRGNGGLAAAAVAAVVAMDNDLGQSDRQQERQWLHEGMQ